MSLKYLNLTGLSRVITNLKNWVTSQIPTKTSEITNDSGFITSSSLPTVNNATLTIQKNGTNVQTFTANASSNKTANITVPTKTSELTNDSGFLTAHQSLSNYVTLNTAQTISGAKTLTGDLIGTSIEGQTIDLDTCYSTTKGATRIYYVTTNGGTNNITNKPVGQAFILYSHTVRRQSASDYVIEQLAFGATTIYFRSCTNGTWTAWKTVSFSDHTHSQYLTAHQSLANYVTLNSDQTISSSKRFAAQQYRYNTSYDAGQNTSTTDFGFTWVDKDLEAVAWINRCHWSNNYSGLSLGTSNKYTNNALATNGTAVHSYIEICTTPTGVPYLNTNAKWWCSVSPANNNAVDLGDTSHHWKSLYIGEVHCYNDNALMSKSGSYTFLLRNDGSNIWFLISEANGNEGTWSGLRPLYINCASGACTSTSKWTFNKSFGDGDPSVLIQSGTAYANGTWNYPLAALAPNMKAGANLFMPIGRNFAAGNCAGWHWCYAGDNSNDNYVSVEFYAVGSHFAVYRDGRVFLSATPATSDNSTRVATTAYVKNQGYLSGTVPIANGGTGATTRLGAVQNLTNENVGTSTQYFLTITQNWGKAGYCSVADAKTVLGIGTTSKKLTLIGERETAGTWTLTCTTLAPIYFKIIASKTSSSAEFVCGITSSSTCRFVMQANNYDTPQIIYSVVSTSSSGVALWGIGIPTSTSITVEVWARNTQYQKVFNVKAYQ